MLTPDTAPTAPPIPATIAELISNPSSFEMPIAQNTARTDPTLDARIILAIAALYWS